MIVLRPDQDKFVGDLRVALRSHQAVLGQAPCGFGKTVVAAHIARSVMEKGRRVIFAVHRRDLITQTARTFDKFGISYGVMQAGYPTDLGRAVFIASISTLQNRLGKLPAHLLVVDECHLSAAEGWSRVVDHYKQTGAHVIGLSATPQRLDGQGLSRHFSELVRGPSVRWLIENGHLSRYRLFAPPSADLSGLHTRMGDFVHGEAEQAMDKSSVTGDAVAHYRKLAMGKRAITFCVSIEHSHHVVAQFNAAGIPSAHMDGETPMEERKRIISDFADNKLLMISNVALATEGWDLAAQVGRDVTIEAVILLRPTQSLALYIQMVGRGIRKKPESGVILDHSGNCMRHGLPDDEREWSLQGQAGGKGKGEKPEVSIAICKSCFAAIPSGSAVCEQCGAVVPKKPREVAHVEGELEEIDIEAQRRERVREQGKAQSLEDLIALGTARGYKDPVKWAGYIFTARAAKQQKRISA